MNGGRRSTTRIWRPPSSTASWSADGSFASMDPRDELVISSWRTPCQAVPNGSEYLEYVAQNFRNPQRRLEAARDTLEKRRQAGFHARSPLLTVTQTVTPNRSREATHWKHGRPGEIRTPDPRFRKTPFGQLSTFKLLNLRAVTGLGLGGNRPL